jgi:hypothetical protein
VRSADVSGEAIYNADVRMGRRVRWYTHDDDGRPECEHLHVSLFSVVWHFFVDKRLVSVRPKLLRRYGCVRKVEISAKRDGTDTK